MAAQSADVATEIEAWLTALGTALAGASALTALLLGWWQFQRSGFKYSVRVITGRPPTALLVTIANKGRLDGHVSAVRVLQRPSAWIRVKNALLRRNFSRAISAKAVPQSVGALIETIQRPMPLNELTADLKPGATVTFRVEFEEASQQLSFRAAWLLVRFGDGRVVKKRPEVRFMSIASPD